jgi:hypothetical protein
MGVVDQMKETTVEGAVSPLHFPITLRVKTGDVDALYPQSFSGLVEKGDICALPWSVK